MTPLGRRIASTIALQGPISIAEFMTMALLDPIDGYYAAHDPLSAGGDFLTAPEAGQTVGG